MLSRAFFSLCLDSGTSILSTFLVDERHWSQSISWQLKFVLNLSTTDAEFTCLVPLLFPQVLEEGKDEEGVQHRKLKQIKQMILNTTAPLCLAHFRPSHQLWQNLTARFRLLAWRIFSKIFSADFIRPQIKYGLHHGDCLTWMLFPVPFLVQLLRDGCGHDTGVESGGVE